MKWVNPIVTNAPFLYTRKTLENRQVFWFFRGLEKGCIGKEWVNNFGNKKKINNFGNKFLERLTEVNSSSKAIIKAFDQCTRFAKI